MQTHLMRQRTSSGVSFSRQAGRYLSLALSSPPSLVAIAQILWGNSI